jgi:N-acetylglucosaminyldiphosphoundecaprenol N-acetyl-beta-D-mannosaminyltransferase
MTGVDVAEEVALQTLQQGKKVFLLGGHTSAASAAERFKILDIRFKELIGFDEGVKDIRNEKHEERRKILEKIANFRPHLLLVAYGAPWQEWWVTANREVLGKAGVRVVMVVGGAFDMWAGKTPRAPILLRKAGLEWLWRLILEPWRIKRQLKLIKFIWMVLNK